MPAGSRRNHFGQLSVRAGQFRRQGSDATRHGYPNLVASRSAYEQRIDRAAGVHENALVDFAALSRQDAVARRPVSADQPAIGRVGIKRVAKPAVRVDRGEPEIVQRERTLTLIDVLDRILDHQQFFVGLRDVRGARTVDRHRVTRAIQDKARRHLPRQFHRAAAGAAGRSHRRLSKRTTHETQNYKRRKKGT
jgi:hypothetical protein